MGRGCARGLLPRRPAAVVSADRKRGGVGGRGAMGCFSSPPSLAGPLTHSNRCSGKSILLPNRRRLGERGPEGSLYFQGCLREPRLSADRPKQKPCPPGARAASHLHRPRLAGLLEGHDGGHNVCAAAAATLCKMCCQRRPAAPECMCVCVCVCYKQGGKRQLMHT